MLDRLTGLKNILWAIGIALCLLLLFIGLIFSAATPYGGDADPRTADLNAVKDQNSELDLSSLNFVNADGTLVTLKDTPDAGEEYLRSVVFLTDSIMVSLRSQSLTGGDIWSSDSGYLPMGSIGSWNILYSDGSKISPAEACRVTKPAILIIAVGSDGLASVTKEEFITGYERLIAGILAESPDTKIVCCSVAPVADGYSSLDGLTDEMAANASDWVKEVCRATGVYFADTADVVRSGSDLNPKYAAANNKALNTEGLKAVLEYFRTHALS